MKDKITNLFLIISGLFLLAYIILFFMPDERKVIEDFFKNQSVAIEEQKNNFKMTSRKDLDKKDLIKRKLENAQKSVVKKTTTAKNKIDTKKQSTSSAKTKTKIISFKVNKPIPLSYKSKEEIYDIRKSYVKNSPFHYEGYEPSPQVFGEIEDWKPWISQYSCRWKSTGETKTEGPSHVSIPIINPSALVILNYAFIPYKCEYVPEHCKFDFWPTNINYNKEKKQLRVIYKMFEHIDPSRRTYYILNGINARDFGYKYAYIDLSKSSFKPEFVEKENISTRVVEFQDLIHVGNACGVKNGCNNHSPDDPNMRIYYSELKSTQHNKLYIKLWKEQPNSPDDEPDIVEILQINYM